MLSALLYALHTAVHSAAREDDTPHICALFTVVSQLRTSLPLLHEHASAASTHSSAAASQVAAARGSTSLLAKPSAATVSVASSSSSSSASSSFASPVLERVYALPFLSNSPLVPSAPPTMEPLLPPPFTALLSCAQWLGVQLLDLQALCHQLVVQAVMSAWQTSLPPLSDVWLDDEAGGGVSVLSAYCSSYAQFDAMCVSAAWSAAQRQSVLSCCLHWLVTELFNGALQLHNLSLDTGLRVKQLCSQLAELARRLVGDEYGSAVAAMLAPLQELAMFLLMDKADTSLDELRMLTPGLPLIALHHLLFAVMQSDEHDEDSVSPQLLQQIATQLAAEQQSGQADKQQESASKPTHIVLMLDFASHTAAALADVATDGVEWKWPEAVLLSQSLVFVTVAPAES